MGYNFESAGAPIVGIPANNGSQTVAIKDRKGVYRTYASTSEKVDEFVSTYQKGKKAEKTFLVGGLTAGAILGAITGIVLKKKIPNTAFDGFVSGVLSALGGIFTGCSAKEFRCKKVDAAVAKLTDGVQQEPSAAVQSQPAAQPAQTTAASGFNNLLKQAQQQKI